MQFKTLENVILENFHDSSRIVFVDGNEEQFGPLCSSYPPRAPPAGPGVDLLMYFLCWAHELKNTGVMNNCSPGSYIQSSQVLRPTSYGKWVGGPMSLKVGNF